MTTVLATRDRMVCDSKVTHGETAYHAKKVYRHRGALIGVAGDSKELGQFLRWYRDGAKPDKVPEISEPTSFDVLVLTPDGELHLYANTFEPDVLSDPHYAVGSGAHAALTAMKCGKNPKEAVELACEIDNGSGGPVQEHLLADATPRTRTTRKG